MPFLGAGVDQHVNVAGTPTWVFTPTPKAASTLRLYNEGSQPVYIGSSSVTPSSGFQILPGNRPVELGNALQTVYACSGVIAGTASTTVGTSVPAGSTSFTVASNAGFTPGTTILLGNNGSSQEVATLAGTTATVFTVSTATLYDHVSGATVQTATSTVAQLRVTAGVV